MQWKRALCKIKVFYQLKSFCLLEIRYVEVLGWISISSCSHWYARWFYQQIPAGSLVEAINDNGSTNHIINPIKQNIRQSRFSICGRSILTIGGQVSSHGRWVCTNRHIITSMTTWNSPNLSPIVCVVSCVASQSVTVSYWAIGELCSTCPT